MPIRAGLVHREMLLGLPPELASRLDALLNEAVLEIVGGLAGHRGVDSSGVVTQDRHLSSPF